MSKEYFKDLCIKETGEYLSNSEIEKYIDALADIYLEKEAEYQIEN